MSTDDYGGEQMNQPAVGEAVIVIVVEVVGAKCILTGIRPAVASALLQLDVRFEHLRLLRKVKFGLRYVWGV